MAVAVRGSRPRAAALLIPLLGFVHLALSSASPEPGAVLDAVPAELRLTFTLEIERDLSTVALIGSTGEVHLAPPVVDGASNVLVLPIQGPVSAGLHTVRWRVVGTDGHPVEGEYTFTIGPDAAGLASDTSVDLHASGSLEPAGRPAASGAESPLYASVRWLTFVGIVGVIGLVAFRIVLGLADRLAGKDSAQFALLGSRGAASLGLWFGGLALVTAMLRLDAQSRALHGAEAVFDSERLRTLVSETLWGWGWIVQVAGALAAVLGFAAALRGDPKSRLGWIIAGGGAIALALSPGLSGHAVAGPARSLTVVADWVHVLASSAWLGGLLGLLVIGIPCVVRTDETPANSSAGADLPTLVRAFSLLALTSASLTVLTGVVGGWAHLGQLRSLWTTPYGRLLLGKLGLVSIVIAAGAYNWLRVCSPHSAGPATQGCCVAPRR